jgi:phosphoglycerol transferase
MTPDKMTDKGNKISKFEKESRYGRKKRGGRKRQNAGNGPNRRKRTCAAGRILLAAATVFFGMLSTVLCTSAAWMFDTWQHLSMEELLYQLNAPIEGTNMEMIEDYVISCVPTDVLVLALMLILLIAARKKGYKKVVGGILASTAAVLGLTFCVTWERLDIGNYINNQSMGSDFVSVYYANPQETAMVFPEKKRNLIYIYLESMEVTFADEEDGGGFEFDCIPELTELAREHEDFSGTEEMLNGGYVMPNTTWTAAAMYGQSSGLPLVTSIGGTAKAEEASFMPQTTTIGDVLNGQGYVQTLLIGSDATFGSRRTLYTEHGEYQIKDYEYAKEEGWIPEDYRVWWGYEDQKLFEFAKWELEELSASGEPFNLTMLTVDTHFEDGYYCERCEEEFDGNVYADVIACSSRQVAEFVEWVQEQDFYENTTIVLAGDHPTMDADFCDDVDSEYERKTYVNIINPAVEAASGEYRTYTTLDLFPTTLAALGVEIEGNRLGLGTDLFSGEETLAERFGLNYMRTELSKRTRMVESLVSGLQVVDKNYLQEDYATVWLKAWNVQAGEGFLPVTVRGMGDLVNEGSTVYARVSLNADGSDAVWVWGYEAGDGTFRLDVPLEKFWYREGAYYIEVYSIDMEGISLPIASTVGFVG